MGAVNDNLAQIKMLADSQGKPAEQLRMAAYLLANRKFIQYLFDGVFSGIPPALLGMVSKLCPVPKEKWHELPINGVYNMDKPAFDRLYDFFASMVDFCRETEASEHIASPEGEGGRNRPERQREDGPAI